MENNLLSIEIGKHAYLPYTNLGSEDRRNIDVWLEQLRNWRNDEFLRSRAKRLKPDEEIYAVNAGNDLFIAFEIADGKVILRSIIGKELLRAFGRLEEFSTA
ncbi:MAG TPA: hypothetical protein VFF52_17135 [Isosphaeraceae bacterium]|nr:hypothetical protein [Isosphaeraceae bacterium]